MIQTTRPTPRVQTIRPTMSMVSDLLPRATETWILNDCAIVETKDGRFFALIFVNLDEFNVMYYGFIHSLHPRITRFDAREKLDRACENYEPLPSNVFMEKVDWSHIDEGHRYI